MVEVKGSLVVTVHIHMRRVGSLHVFQMVMEVVGEQASYYSEYLDALITRAKTL